MENKENLNLSSDECMIEITNNTFGFINELLSSVSEMLGNKLFQIDALQEPKRYIEINLLREKATKLSELSTRSEESFDPVNMIRLFLEDLA
jgi:hypothetical protein